MAISDEEQLVLNAGRKAEEFQKSEWWDFYCSLVDGVTASQASLLTAPAGDIGGLLRTEYQKGTVNGLRLLRGVFDETIAQAKAIRRREEELEGEEEENAGV